MVDPIEFRRQAAEAGFPVRCMTVYRLDGRSPDEVRTAGGLLPNPTKPPLSMRQHVMPGCTGGSLFVSTSTQAGNFYNIKNTDFIVSHVLRGPTDEQAIAWMKGKSKSVQAALYGVYEYEISGVDAAEVVAGGVSGEREALIAGALPSHISRYRHVFLRAPGIVVDGYATFAAIKDGRVRLGSWRAL